MKDRLLVVAVVVPLLGLLALIGRAEFNLQDGRPWLLPIRGYDPRDLISGHYLRFTYDLHPQPSTCGAPPGDFAPADALDASCCLCLQPPSEWPEIRQLTCEEAASAGCMSWIRSADVIGEQRYFIPEGRGAELEQAIRERNAAMRVRVTDDGTLAIEQLYFDGEPWTP
ncbi:MAG: GDYXXLXY domain-containing protein [Myxococcales bacterium]|nr:GDYXXLXY domain-containing protein [Myxococcales bacterium]